MKVPTFPGFEENYAAIAGDGGIEMLKGGAEFWSQDAAEMNRIGQGWLVTEFSFDTDWPTWEMHPEGDEVVYLLSGSVDLLLEKDGWQDTAKLRQKGLVIVPRGTWHTAKVLEPSRMLVITKGAGTCLRPV